MLKVVLFYLVLIVVALFATCVLKAAAQEPPSPCNPYVGCIPQPDPEPEEPPRAEGFAIAGETGR